MRNSKRFISVLLCALMLITMVAVVPASASTDTLCSKYATNPNGKVGVQKTITIDGSASDWSEDMLIAQGAAWDVANNFKGAHENCVLDTYALFGAWDSQNLYIGWQMVNTTDTWAREGDGPLSDGGRVLDVPLILALSVDPSSTSMSNKNTDGKSIWGQKMGLTFEQHVDHLFYMSGKPGLGEPSMFTAVDAQGNTNYTTGCVGYAKGGIEYKMAETNICSQIWGLDGSKSPKDIYSDSANWVDFKTKNHNVKYDSFYEMKIPLSTLKIDANYISKNGIGAMLVATRGESGLDCIPYDDTMLDNATGSYSNDPSTSKEKEDEDVITSPFARIGKSSGSAPIITPTQATQATQATESPYEPTEYVPDDPTVPDLDPIEPAERVLIGDANQDGSILISDATAIQRHVGKLRDLSELGQIAADCNGDELVSIKDATLVQKFLAGYRDTELVGKYSDEIGGNDPQPVTYDPQPNTDEPQPNTEEPVIDGPASFYFSDALGWGDIHVYAWNDAGDVTAAWPGDSGVEGELNPYGQMVYTINVPEGATGVIVNGGGKQTANITDFRPAGGGYYVSADQTEVDENGTTVYTAIPWGEPVDPPVDDPDYSNPNPEPLPGGTFYFSDALGWGDIHVYAWNDAGDLTAAWPGDAGAPGEMNPYGQMVYTITVPDGATGVIVNGGGNQTDNIIDFAPAGGGYYVDASQTSVNEFGSTVYVPIPWGEPVDPPVDNPDYTNPNPDPLPGGSFYFSDALGWGDIHVYAWNDAGDVTAAWPGDAGVQGEMNPYGQMVYTITVPEGATGVIVNGTGGQTDNITDFNPGGGGYYVDASRTSVNEFGATVYVPIAWDTPIDTPVDNPIDNPDPLPGGSFQFSDSLGWGDIHVYVYGPEGDLGAAWPGNSVSQTDTNPYGQAVYTINVPAGATGIVINGNGKQTSNITDFNPAGGGYYVDGSKTSTNEYGAQTFDPIPWG